MDRSNIIYLVSYNQTQNALGVWVKNTTKKKVFCGITSVSQAEWYEGSRNGLNPQLRITVFRYDYDGQEAVEYNGKLYAIYRTYVGRNETIDLYVEERKGAKWVEIEDTPETPEQDIQTEPSRQ